MLLDFPVVGDRTDSQADLGRPGEGAALTALGDLLQGALGGGEEFFAFAGALGGNQGVAARRHEPCGRSLGHQPCDGLALLIRRQVRVSQCHRERCVPEEFADGVERHAGLHQA